MNTSSNGASTLGRVGTAEVKNPKTATVSEAVNGFVVSTQRVETYGADMHVAKDADEVTLVLRTYFDA